MGDYIALGIVIIIVAVAIVYIVKQKKKGVKCIGCPHAQNCVERNCNCNSQNNTN